MLFLICQHFFQKFLIFLEDMMVGRVKALCEARGLKITNLEKKLDISRGSIVNWDDSSPGIRNVMKVAKEFGVSLEYLVYGIETVPLKDIEFTREEINLIHEYRKLDFKSQTAVNNKILEEEAKNDK